MKDKILKFLDTLDEMPLEAKVLVLGGSFLVVFGLTWLGACIYYQLTH
jgi:hypothetical protein